MGGVEPTASQSALQIGNAVTLRHEPASAGHPHGFAVLEWEGGARSDMISDAVIAILLQVAEFLRCHPLPPELSTGKEAICFLVIPR